MRGSNLKQEWMEMHPSCFETISFKDIKESEKFIALPQPGDNSGHGGFKKASYIFQKLRMSQGSNRENAVRVSDGTLSDFPDSMMVLKVE